MQRQPRPRKLITRVIVFVFAGAIINVAVAWGCALWIAPRWQLYEWRSNHVDPYIVRYASYQIHPHTLDTVHAAGIGYRETTWYGGGPGPLAGIPDIPRRIVHRAGWPMYCWVGFSDSRKKVIIDAVAAPDWLHPRQEISRTRVVPLRPIWPGFASNTIFYAAILWLLFAAPGVMRRVARRRRGLCSVCAYPVGQSPVCTECGAVVSRIAGR